MEGIVHTSIMVEEALGLLAPGAGPSLLVDATLGEGGHSEAFLRRYPALSVAGVDADAEIQAKAIRRLAPFGDRFRAFNRFFDEFFADYPADLPRPDRVLMDLGISMFHFEASGRGFSFRADEPLDMRISGAGKSAADLVNGLREEELADLIYAYGEERYSRRIARAVAEARRSAPISRASELADIVAGAVPREYREGRIHSATRTFQALRIAVNGELERLPRALEAALRALVPGGRIGVITFHSLEDRIVKNFFREQNRDCVCPPEQPRCSCGGKRAVDLVTRKPLAPQAAEVAANPASRSAKFRVAEKLVGGRAA